MRNLLTAALFLAACSECVAADVSLRIANGSGRAITGLTLTAKSNAVATANLLPALAAGASANVNVVGGNPTCVYALSITFAAGPATNIPDVDICQTTSVSVE